MRGYVWRVLFDNGEIKEVTAPNITAALLLTVSVFHPERVVSCVRMEEITRPEEISLERIGVVTA